MLDLGGAIGQGEVAVTNLLGQGQGPLSQVSRQIPEEGGEGHIEVDPSVKTAPHPK